MSHLLDTDVCITILRDRDPDARDRLRAMRAPSLSTVTLAELAYGAAHSRAPEQNRAEVELLAASLDILPLDAAAATESGLIRAELAAVGQPIGGYDLLIAGTARAHGLTLVTGNVGEFSRVEGLAFEEW